VVSRPPSTPEQDRFLKRRRYQEAGRLDLGELFRLV